MINTGRVISTAIQLIDGFTKPSKEVISSMQKMANNIKKNADQIQKTGKAISSVGRTLTAAITVPIAGAATACIKTAADFEASMSKVGAISGAVENEELPGLIQKAKEMELSFVEGANATETAMNILKAKAQQMGATTAFSASESAEAMQYMAMAGWKTADMMDGIAGIMNLAAASGEELAATSDIVTDGLTAFGLAAKDSERFADVLAAASSNANTNVAMMGESFKYCAPIAGSLGYSIEDTAVALGIMANSGVKGSQAGNALKTSLARMASGTGAVGSTMKSLGISMSDSTGAAKSLMEVMQNLRSSIGTVNVDLVDSEGNLKQYEDIIGDLSKTTEGLSQIQQIQAASTIFGKDNMAAMLTLVNAGENDFNKLSTAIYGSSGVAKIMADKMLDNLNGQLILLKSAVEGAAIMFGNKLLPYIKKATAFAQGLIDKINNLSDTQVNNIVKWAGIAAAAGPALMIFGKIVTGIGAMQKAWAGAIKIFAKFEGIMGIITSPAGIVVASLAAIALAAGLIIKNWNKISPFLQNIASWFKRVFEQSGFSVQEFKDKFSSIGNAIGSISTKIGNACRLIANKFNAVFANGIHQGSAKALKILEKLVKGTIVVFNGLVTAADKGIQIFHALLNFFVGAFSGNWNSATQEFKKSVKDIFSASAANHLINAFDKVLPAIVAIIEGVKAAFRGLIQDIKTIFVHVKTVFSGIGTVFKGIFTGNIETALNGFKMTINGALDVVGSLIKAKINLIKNFVIGAVSTFLPKSAVDKIAGAFDIVIGKWDIAIHAAKGCVSGFINAIKPLIQNIQTIFKGIAQFVKGVFSGDFKGALNGLKTIAGGALSGLVNIIKTPFIVIENTVKRAISAFKRLNIVKNIFASLGNIIKNVLTKSGVDMTKFSANISNKKIRVGNIINNLKVIFSTVFSAIGKVIGTVARVAVPIFGKVIYAAVMTVVGVFLTLKEVISAVFGFISGAVKIIAPVVNVAFSAISGAISSAIHTITAIISGLLTIFDGITTFIAGTFTGNWQQAWEGIKTIFGGIFDSLVALCKAPINAVIGIINGAIAGINSIKVNIPDWVPGLGGKSYGVNIPTIPMLYKGTKNWMGGAAIIHDRGGEIVDLPKGSRVYPHDKSVEMARRDGAKQSGNITINIQKLADKIEVRNDEDIDRIAQALALKLKKVALNTGTA